VHGEEATMKQLANLMQGQRVEMPLLGEAFDL
jgi:hypothetical protein